MARLSLPSARVELFHADTILNSAHAGRPHRATSGPVIALGCGKVTDRVALFKFQL